MKKLPVVLISVFVMSFLLLNFSAYAANAPDITLGANSFKCTNCPCLGEGAPTYDSGKGTCTTGGRWFWGYKSGTVSASYNFPARNYKVIIHQWAASDWGHTMFIKVAGSTYSTTKMGSGTDNCQDQVLSYSQYISGNGNVDVSVSDASCGRACCWTMFDYVKFVCLQGDGRCGYDNNCVGSVSGQNNLCSCASNSECSSGSCVNGVCGTGTTTTTSSTTTTTSTTTTSSTTTSSSTTTTTVSTTTTTGACSSCICCLPAGTTNCDQACKKVYGQQYYGWCQYPFSTDQSVCCGCALSTNCTSDSNCPTGQKCTNNACVDVGCVAEGNNLPGAVSPDSLKHMATTCCAGLSAITNANYFDANCNKVPVAGAGNTCAKCGNGVCGPGETKCNCPTDCGGTTTCTDTDGGKNYNVKGTVKISTGPNAGTESTDVCLSSTRLLENYCTNDFVTSSSAENYICPNGCNDGACVQTQTSSCNLWGIQIAGTGWGVGKIPSGGKIQVVYKPTTTEYYRAGEKLELPNDYGYLAFEDWNSDYFSTIGLTPVNGITVYNYDGSSVYGNLNGLKINSDVENGLQMANVNSHIVYFLFDKINGNNKPVVIAYYNPVSAKVQLYDSSNSNQLPASLRLGINYNYLGLETPYYIDFNFPVNGSSLDIEGGIIFSAAANDHRSSVFSKYNFKTAWTTFSGPELKLGNIAASAEDYELKATTETATSGIGKASQEVVADFGILIQNPSSNGASDQVVIKVPDKTLAAKVYMGKKSGTSYDGIVRDGISICTSATPSTGCLLSTSAGIGNQFPSNGLVKNSEYSKLKSSTFSWKSNDYAYHEQFDVAAVQMRHSYTTTNINGTEKMVIGSGNIKYEYVFDQNVNFGGTISNPDYTNPIKIKLMGTDFVIVGIGAYSIKALRGSVGTANANVPVKHDCYSVYAILGSNNDWVKVQIKDNNGNVVATDTVSISGGAKSFSSISLDVRATRVQALQDGTVIGADLVVGPTGTTEKEYDTSADTTSTGTASDRFPCDSTTTTTCTVTATCTDSDGGKNYYVKGTTHTSTTNISSTYIDCCADDNGNYCFTSGTKVNELYCENGEMQQTQFNCPNGCKDGACAQKIGLGDYPNYLFKDNALDSFFVIGSDGTPAEFIGAIDAIVRMPEKTTTTTTTPCTSSGYCTADFIAPIKSFIARLDTEVGTFEKTKNLIIIGRPWSNQLINELGEAGKFLYTYSNLPQGDFGIIDIIENAYSEGKVAFVVFGTTDAWTRTAATLLQQYETKLSDIDASSIKLTGDPSAPAITVLRKGSVTFKNYPNFFFKDGVFDAYVVVGNAGTPSDVIAAMDIIVRMPEKSTATTISSCPSDGYCTVKKIVPITNSIAKLDTEVGTVEKTKNLVSFGGPCVNRITAQALGLAYPSCGASSCIPEHSAIIGIFNDIYTAGKIVQVVEGWEASQTRTACSVLQQYDMLLEGITASKVKVTSATSMGITPTEIKCGTNSYILNFQPGWNMFSWPVKGAGVGGGSPPQTLTETMKMGSTASATTEYPSDVTPTTTIPTQSNYCNPISKIYHYANGRYEEATYPIPGYGYWVKMQSSCSITLSGEPITVADFAGLSSGWNQIGSPSQAINFFSIIGSCNLLSGPWKFNSYTQAYEKSQMLLPGEGYFVRMGSSCTLGTDIPQLPPEVPTGGMVLTGRAIQITK